MTFLPRLPKCWSYTVHDHSWALQVLKPFLQENITLKSGRPRINLILVRRLISCSHGFCHNSLNEETREDQVWQTPIPGSYSGLWKELISWSQKKWLTGPDSRTMTLCVVSEPKSVKIKEKPETFQWCHAVATGPDPRTGTAWVKSQLFRPARPPRSPRKASSRELECSSSSQATQRRNTGVLDRNVSSLDLETPASESGEPYGDVSCSLFLGPAVFPPSTSQHLFPQLDAGGTRTEICLETPKMLLPGD